MKSNDKYNNAMPDILAAIKDMTPWEVGFMETIAEQYQKSGMYTIGQKNVLDRLIQVYIDKIPMRREEQRTTGPFEYNNNVKAVREEGGYQVYVDGCMVGPKITRKEQMIIGAWLEDAIDDIKKVATKDIATQEPSKKSRF